ASSFSQPARPPQESDHAVKDAVNPSAPPLTESSSEAGYGDSFQAGGGVAFLIFSNDAAEGLSRDDFTQARIAT
ncbi:hypothetical protein CSUI_007141, partial [Cystoisospora suis]